MQTISMLMMKVRVRETIIGISIALLTALVEVNHASAAVRFSGRITVQDVGGKDVEDMSNVVVYLRQIGGHRANLSSAAAGKKYRMDSKAKLFDPEVLVVPVGSEVEFPNADPVLHNVFSLSKLKPFDLGLYGKGVTKSVVFDKPGIIRVYCNIHQKMNGYIAVLDTPHHALTTKDGAFTVDGLTAGEYEMGVWHRFGGGFEKKLTVIETDPTSQNFEAKLTEQSRLIKHGNKFGQEYPDKY